MSFATKLVGTIKTNCTRMIVKLSVLLGQRN